MGSLHALPRNIQEPGHCVQKSFLWIEADPESTSSHHLMFRESPAHGLKICLATERWYLGRLVPATAPSFTCSGQSGEPSNRQLRPVAPPFSQFDLDAALAARSIEHFRPEQQVPTGCPDEVSGHSPCCRGCSCSSRWRCSWGSWRQCHPQLHLGPRKPAAGWPWGATDSTCWGCKAVGWG